MKHVSRFVYRITAVGAVLLGATFASAQRTAPAPAAPPPKPEDAELIELTPFEVTASGDVGYQATETLAGTRIRTDLRDVGSAVSVATKEFMRDIGATDNQTLLQYMPSSEVGGARGNFSGLGDDSVPNAQDSLLRPNNNNRVRGLASATNARDFYQTDIPWDGYNIGRVELLRGANSVLFGNGSGAGIISNTTEQATFGRNQGMVEARYGSFASYRGVLSFNHQLVPNELALRVATVFDRRNYQQEPAYNEDQRAYGAVRYEPSFLKRGTARTQLRASFEAGDIEANRPRSNTPYDALFPWFLTSDRRIESPDGTLLGVVRPMKSHAGYDPFVTAINDAALIASNPTRRDIGARAAFNTATANNSEAWLGRGTGPGIAGWQNGGFGAIFSEPTASQSSFYVLQAPGPFYNAINSSGVRDGNVQGIRTVDNAAIVRLDQYSILGVGGRLADNDGFLYERQGVYKNVGLTDPSVFNFYEKLLDGPNKKEAAKFTAFNAQLEQTFFNDKLGVQLAYDQQEYSEYQLNYLNNDSTLTIDVYRYLPLATVDPATGLFQPVPNPNFGRPFVAITPGGRRAWRGRETLRATPYVDLDSKALLRRDDLFTRIVGRHMITGLFERNDYFERGLNFTRWAIEPNNAAALFGPNATVGSASRRLAAVTYLGPSLAAASTAADANLSNIVAQQNVATGPAYYFDATYRTGAPAPGTAWTRQAGLAPNQTGTNAANAALFEAENPTSYNGWGGTLNHPAPRTLNVTSAEAGWETPLTTSDGERVDQTRSWAVVDQWKLLNDHLVFTGGMRRDEIKSYRPGAPTIAPESRTGNRAVPGSTGAVDYTAPFEYAGTPTNVFKSEPLKTWSVVGHSPNFINRHLPFALRVSAFVNHSENFRPAARVGVLGEPLTPPTGETKDYGVLISALDGRVSFKFNRYETNVNNDSLNDNNVLTTMGDEVKRGMQFALAVQNRVGNYRFVAAPGAGTGSATPLRDAQGNPFVSAYQPARAATAANPWTLAEWQAADAQAQAQAKAFLDATLRQTQFLNAWNIRPENFNPSGADNDWNIRHDTPLNSAVTGDTRSTGSEFELFLRPIDNWNIAMNASRTRAQRLALAGVVSDWIEQRWDLLQGPAGDLRWFGGGNGGGTSNAAALPGDPIADYGRVRVGRNVWRWYNEYRAKEGSDVPELRRWRFNLTTNYRFTGNRLGGEKLKGLFVGGSYRWADRNVIGWQVKEVTPALGTVNPAIGAYDITKPFYGPEEKHVDLFLGYTRRIFKAIDWRVQLNVYNAFDRDRLIPINTNPDGSPAGVRIAYGPTWNLTSRFEF